MTKSIITVVFFLLSIISISQNRFVTFEEISGDKKYYYHYKYSSSEKGNIIQSVKIDNNDTVENQILTTDKKFNSLKWEYIRQSDNTHVIARLRKDIVVFKGKHDGEKIDEAFDLDGYKWIQIFPMNPGLNEYIKKGKEEIRFWIIGNAGPADMEINKFVATLEGRKKLSIMGKKIDCWDVEMTLSGWRSIFWSGNYYYSKNEMHVVKYDGGGVPGDPGSVTTIISEKQD